MKLLKRALLMLLALTLLLPCAAAEEPAAELAAPTYAPLTQWLTDRNQPAPAPYPPLAEGYLPDQAGYHDDTLDVTIETSYWTSDIQQVDAPSKETTTVMAVRVKLTDVSQFRTGLASNYPSKYTARVDAMAKRNNAVLAINGDFFNYHSNGVAYRNGHQLRYKFNEPRDLLVVDAEGDFHYIIPTDKATFNRSSQKGYRQQFEDYLANGGTVLHTFWFGPSMVNPDGTPVQRFDGGINNGPNSHAQRIVIGQTGPLEYLILCSEGPESTRPKSVGFTLAEMARLCVAFGMTNGYNLDGGSSCCVSLDYTKINSPSNPKRREVGDTIYFATLIPPTEAETPAE